jgi:serine phosphatase RsbU (regulator of sigma subunit)
MSQPLMRSLFHHRASEHPPLVEPVPNSFPRIEGAEIGAAFSGKRVGGDFYDAFRANPQRILFGMLDVAGRREDIGGILSAAQDIFRNRGTVLFSAVDINEADAMTELCLELNRGVIDAASGVHSCPAFIACYHEQFGTLCYTNAGHIPALLRDSSGISELASTGLPLGLFSHATCDAPIEGLEKGAALLVVSRGMVECGGDHDKSSQEFGLKRVQDSFAEVPRSGAQELCTRILNAASEFSPLTALCDDRTALAFVRLG